MKEKAFHSTPKKKEIAAQTIICDTNSLIYLAKTGLLELCCAYFTLIIPIIVKDECFNGKPGGNPETEEISVLIAKKKIIIQEQSSPSHCNPRLDAGEQAVYDLYLEVPGAVILTDDKKAVTLLKNNGISFISTPLIPVLLAKKNVLGREQAKKYIHHIGEIGYFSKQVLNYAYNKLSLLPDFITEQ